MRILRVRLLLPLLSSSLLVFGCNAILGTDEPSGGAADSGTSNGDTDGAPSNVQEQGGDEHQGPTTEAGAEAGLVRNDTKPPCDTCGPVLVARTASSPKEVRVSGKFVYWVDAKGVYRVDRSAPPCLDEACKEVIEDETDSAKNFAVNDSHVCWTNYGEFGCAEVSDLSKRKRTDSGPLKLAGDRMRMVDDTLYTLQRNGVASTLVRGSSTGVAAGTASFGNISSPTVKVTTFDVTSTHIAWLEEASDSTKVYVKALAGGEPKAIPLPTEAKDWWVRDLSLHGNYLYIAPYREAEQIYRAPITGGEEAKPLFKAEGTRIAIANSGGLYMAFGDSNLGISNGIGWSPLDPKALDAAAGKTLTTPAGEVVAMTVADDGIYYAEYIGGGQSSIWRIKFE
ncbi:MAG TPA: hypothetical protein VM925_24455 [Labilithrix sp.]|nr:hypothetical protein [Labilithrix sp.]